jgi:hypothetical protein
VLDRRATVTASDFAEHTYAGDALSDHCAVSVVLGAR